MERNKAIGCCQAEAQMPCFHGLHIRSTANLVRLARSFSSEVYVERGSQAANAKNPLGMLVLGITFGVKVQVMACGDDAKEAVSAIARYLNEKANCFE